MFDRAVESIQAAMNSLFVLLPTRCYSNETHRTLTLPSSTHYACIPYSLSAVILFIYHMMKDPQRSLFYRFEETYASLSPMRQTQTAIVVLQKGARIILKTIENPVALRHRPPNSNHLLQRL